MSWAYRVLVTGHNLDDEAAVLWGNTLNWQMQYLARQAPVFAGRSAGPGPQGQTAVPFLRARDGGVCGCCGIEYIYAECPFAAARS